MSQHAAANTALTFRARYYADRVSVLNPRGDVGLITMWSPVRTVERKLNGIDARLLHPHEGRVAAIANLYGEGMYAMLCNLLYNPQIRHLVAVGEEVGLPTVSELEAFLADGLEDTELMGRPMRRVRGTSRLFPAHPDFDEGVLRHQLSFRYLGRLSAPDFDRRIVACLNGLACGPPPGRDRIEVPLDVTLGDDYEFLPSDPMAHQVVRPSPLQAWRELVTRVMRFGRPMPLPQGERLALLNVKAVLTAPEDDDLAAAERYGFDPDRLREYQYAILDPALPEGVSYAYGHRMRSWFPQGDGSSDALATVIGILRDEPHTRRAYVSLWDTAHDLPGDAATPCLTTLYFRVLDGRLTLAATYRAHNLLTAWLQNVYGLMSVLRHVAEGAGLVPGEITVLSHFLGIDPASPRFEIARQVRREWTHDDDVAADGKRRLREDPHGYFAVSVDQERGVIVAEHRYRGVLIKRYEAPRAVTIENDVAADMAVSLVSHALWLGRELTLKEQQLRGR